jgi:hypothetical protein
MVRIAFVLANLTTFSEEAREQVGNADNMRRIVKISCLYFDKDKEQ